VRQLNNNELSIKVRKVIDRLTSSEIGSYVDRSLTPPEPFRGRGKIKLIVLGQDPTVQKPEHRKQIEVTLLLNQQGRLKTYLEDICKGLGIDLDENIYATNLLKNFFTIPPDKRRKEDPQFIQKAADHWIPLLKEEIEKFENVLSRAVFPFSHLLGLRHKFYRQQMDGYLKFMKKHVNP